MRFVRTFFTLLVAASLAVLPARVGAFVVNNASGAVASSMPHCASIGDASCELAQPLSADASDMAPMSDGCDRSDRGTVVPDPCSTYCNSLPDLPTIAAITADVILIAAVAPAIGTILRGISVSPEPHPPKLV